MKSIVVLLMMAFLCNCASDPENMRLPPPEGMPLEASLPPPAPRASPEVPRAFDVNELQTQLGLKRGHEDLGYDARDFDGCQWGVKGQDGSCGKRFLSVVNFRLVCRDSVETVQNVSTVFRPLASSTMQWRLAGVQGQTRTDSEGFGQALIVSSKPTAGERFILVIGKKSLGLEVGEVSQIILPGNWCGNAAMNNGLSIPSWTDFTSPFLISDQK